MVVKVDMVLKVEAKREIIPHWIIKMLHTIVAKKGHIANHYTKPTLVPKDDNKSGEALKAIQLGTITFF